MLRSKMKPKKPASPPIDPITDALPDTLLGDGGPPDFDVPPAQPAKLWPAGTNEDGD